MTDVITVTMPYFADVSVNRYKTARGIIRRPVKRWMKQLEKEAWVQAYQLEYARYMHSPLLVGIEIIAASRGHLPDTENFRKVIHDSLMLGMGIDDQQFVAWQEMSPPARRPVGDEQSAIIVRVKGS